ncbi:carbohydrate ABC transporter permease [Mangrovicoccus sp. HB161399]|uniref:carbohydrate ABC transporter permease n=1 Tax=Mangrovicoccus sp. HB161399 TaxID=2720392 RepID=UPI0015527C4C|nr:sugar ABC transporter permease [Mangrovicoccus sp. HB161399]
MSRNREAKRAAIVLVSPAMLLLFALNIFPVLYAVYISLHHWSLASPNPPRFAGLFNYQELWYDGRFSNSLGVSATFIALAVLIELALGFGLAFLFNRKLRGLETLRKLSLLPVMAMPLVVGLVWFYMLNQNFGVTNWVLSLFGIGAQPFLTDGTLAMLSVVLADVWQWTPFVMLVIFAALQSLPEYVFEAARMDGLTEREIFRRITLPLLRPAILVVLVIRAIDAFRMIELVFMMTKGGPGGSTEVLPWYIYTTGFLSLDLGYAAAMAVVMIVLVTLGAQVFVRKIADPGAA